MIEGGEDMFREMRRFKQQLSKEECEAVLEKEKRAVLSVIGDDGYPYGVPINYFYDKERGSIVFHSAKVGHKVDAMEADDRVCFTVFEKEGEPTEDWSYFVNSVICFGRAVELEGAEKERAARLFGAKYFPTAEELEAEMGEPFTRVRITEIKIEHMSGKHVHEK